MKNEELKYLLRGVLVFLALLALFYICAWIMDEVFNGAILDWLSTFVWSERPVHFYKYRIAQFSSALAILLAALLSLTGTISAYMAHRKQAESVRRAREEIQLARELATVEMQRKNDMLAYLAHDLKTPLASVIAYLSLMSESPDISAEQRAKYTGIALQKAYRLEELTGELFEIIRFNLQNIELEKTEIPLRMMLMQLAEEFDPLVSQQGKRIDIICNGDLMLYGDPDKLARVFNNILKNAVAYSSENTRLRIEAQKNDGQVVLRFINQGVQIPEAKLQRIFEKFYRADEARSSHTGGSGLGLAVAKEIVRAHGGQISAQSNRDFTVFTVTLPAK